MPNKPISDEKLSETLNFVATPTMKGRVVGIARQRGVRNAVAVRWAVEYWLANGAPMPTPETETEESQA